MTNSSRFLGTLMLCGALAAAGCRQTDGAVPVPAGEQPNKVNDIARDLQNLAGNANNAENELLEDINSLDSTNRPPQAVADVATSLAVALAGKPVTDEQALALANLVFTSATGRQLSPGQIDTLGKDITTAVESTGAPADAAQRAGAAASTLASAVTINKRRWYHFF